MINHWSGGGVGRFVAPGNMLSAGQNMSKHLPPVRLNGTGRYIGVRGLGAVSNENSMIGVIGATLIGVSILTKGLGGKSGGTFWAGAGLLAYSVIQSNRP